MKKKILNYMKELENSKSINTKDLLVNIKLFQHERLIHLIVTVFVGLATILFFGIGLLTDNLFFIVLALITLILFAFYILHYYFLENSVQKLYDYYWNNKKNSN